MSDPRPQPADSPRPRPQYGEYATPEEQRRRSGRENPAAAPGGVQPPASAALPAPAPGPSPAHMAPASDEPRSSAVPAHPLDRLVSLGLLAFGLWNVISAVATYLNPSPLMAQMMQMLGISGEFTNDAMAKTWGIAAGAVLIIGWILTAAWTVLRLRRGKIAWWVPLVGGVVFVALASVLLVVPFYSDPAVISYIDQQVRNPT